MCRLCVLLLILVLVWTVTFLSPNGRYLVVDYRSQLINQSIVLFDLFSQSLRDVAEATNFWAKFVTPPSFDTVSFRHRLEFRNIGKRVIATKISLQSVQMLWSTNRRDYDIRNCNVLNDAEKIRIFPRISHNILDRSIFTKLSELGDISWNN